jgi:7,8-dihydro-6-hydroxymethylpterin-pyrophosphokinase
VSAALGYIGLGSNLGDRRAMLQAAVEDLWAHGVQAIASSSVYETEPVGEVLDQPAFLNACVRIETALGPEALLDASKAVEAALGRASASEQLEIPHRELARRRFVLVPLLELDPGLRLPDGTSLAAALAALEGQEVRRAGPPLDVRA